MALGSINGKSSNSSSAAGSPTQKLINLESPTSFSGLNPLSSGNSPGKTGNSSGNTENSHGNTGSSPENKSAPPAPPPRTTSDPNYNQSDNNNETIPVSVTYFSSGLNGEGLERETIFTDDHATSADAAAIVRQHLGSGTGGSNPFKNPFLDGEETHSNTTTLDHIVEKKIQDLINGNPFGNTGNGNNHISSKFNTIGRSNPFTSNSKNPFLDANGRSGTEKIAATSSGEDVNDSPDSSLEPEDETEAMAIAPSINKIVSLSRMRCLANQQLLMLNKHPLKHFGHSFSAISLNFLSLDNAAQFCRFDRQFDRQNEVRGRLQGPITILNGSW